MSQSAARQATWEIDSVGGSDYNTGVDHAHALKTWAELRRRIGGAGGLFKQATTITVPNALPSTDPMLIDFGVDTSSTSTSNGLTIIASYSAVAGAPTGTVGTARVRNPSTRVYNGITSSTGGFDWSPYAVSDRIVTGTGGAINGCRAWVVSNDGSALATMSTFLNPTTIVETTITNGDTYAFTQLVRVDTAQFRPPRGALLVKGFVFTGTVQFAKPGSAGMQFTECSFEVPWVLTSVGSNAIFINCRYQTVNSLYSVDTASASLIGGLYISTGPYASGGQGFNFLGGGNGAFSRGFFFKNTGSQASDGGYINFIDAMWSGGCQDYCCIRVYRQGRVLLQSVSGFCSGVNAPYGLQLDNSACVLYGGVTILNIIGDTGLGGGDVVVAQQGVMSWAEIKSGGAWHIGGAQVSVGPQV